MAPRGLNAGLLAVLALCAGCREAPEGVTRLAVSAESRGHSLDRRSGKLLYLEGDYPYKTFFCVHDLAAGEGRKWHFPGYRLRESYAYLDKAGQAVLDADYGSGKSRERRLLRVSLADGAVLKAIPLAPEVAPVALGRPGWTEKVFVILAGRDKTYLKTLDCGAGTEEDAVLVGEFRAKAAAFPEASPLVVLDAEAEGKPLLAVYDLIGGKLVRELRTDAGFGRLEASDDGALAHVRPAGDAKEVVVRISPQLGPPQRLAAIEGGIESLLEADGRLYVTAGDPARPPQADGRYHPRFLTIMDKDGSPSPEGIAWTKRGGRLVGYDARLKAVVFAATQPASVWAIAADKGALARAALELDRTAGEFWGVSRESRVLLVLGVVAAVVMAVLVFNGRPSCKSCDS
ncbi:MAG: hypothetical protein HY927_09060 [Elusimicrobia bacterium]|nr:hypothetical protein [Elusimicrobiota bacterium]